MGAPPQNSPVRPLLAIALALVSLPVLADGPLERSCPVCHGTPQSPSQVPSFHGLPSGTIATMLRDFRAGTREGTAMPRLAGGMSDAQIEALARRFGSPR